MKKSIYISLSLLSFFLGTTLLSSEKVSASNMPSNFVTTENFYPTSSIGLMENEEVIVSEKFEDLNLFSAPNSVRYSAWITKGYPLYNYEKSRWFVQYRNGRKYQGWITHNGKYKNLRVVHNRYYLAEFEFTGTLQLVN
ncbi:hypothetical protein [Vagococcus silagei]|uniref:Surface layer protein A domain-containing protein n=1 Tax=Vagococcus silagei TaxID=2508885 RepID=A0A4S3B4P2_9ENTE|nr:hypothetical protein [Vagococcus silagei]THB60583.1 hypothetical protein ESZ54_09580 [Vagococcus silagei]